MEPKSNLFPLLPSLMTTADALTQAVIFFRFKSVSCIILGKCYFSKWRSFDFFFRGRGKKITLLIFAISLPNVFFCKSLSFFYRIKLNSKRFLIFYRSPLNQEKIFASRGLSIFYKIINPSPLQLIINYMSLLKYSQLKKI